MADNTSTICIFNSLKENLSAITREFDTSARVIYIDYPVHLNVGDLLINLGTEKFFEDNKLNIWRRYYLLNVPESIPGMDDCVVFMMHGGGNFGDLYDMHQAMREHLLARYPNNRFVFLPQTVHFNDPLIEQRSLRKMALHRNAKFFGRDARSAAILIKGGIPDVGTMPDMAHQLWGDLKPSGESISKEPFYLMRRDRERKDNTHDGIIPRGAQEVDWDDVISRRHHIMSGIVRRFMHLQAILHSPVEYVHIWYFIRDLAVQDGVNAISNHSLVITDRLHGMLLSLLLQRKVLALDNSYGKISTYADTWLSEAGLLELHHT